MLLKQIEYFLKVIETGSFSKAAEECYISQSAVSQQIKALEEELGVELLKRHNRTFSLTDAGEIFYRKALVIQDDVTSLRKELSAARERDMPSLRIGYLKCYGGREFEDALSEFSSVYPDVDIKVVYGNHEDLYRALIHSEVDLVINDQRRAFSDAYINFELVRSHCFIEISSKHPFSNMEKIEAGDLKNFTCILVASKEQQENEQSYYRDIVGFRGNFMFAETLQAARILVAANKGFLPIEGIQNDVYYDSSISHIPLYSKNMPVRRNYCAFWRDGSDNYYVEEFADILKKEFESYT